MLNKDVITKLDMKDPAIWLATWWGCGLMRPGPGTWGTLGGLPFGIILLVLGGWPVLLVSTLFIFWAGYRASARFEAMTGEHDSGAIVVDEVAGIWVTLLFALPAPIYILLAFILFRLFDILKPWPVSWCDRKLPGALGVMADDIVAGILAGLCLWGVRYAGLF